MATLDTTSAHVRKDKSDNDCFDDDLGMGISKMAPDFTAVLNTSNCPGEMIISLK